jgi:hypothetical protein
VAATRRSRPRRRRSARPGIFVTTSFVRPSRLASAGHPRARRRRPSTRGSPRSTSRSRARTRRPDARGKPRRR